MGQLELHVEQHRPDGWQFVGKKWASKNYPLFAVLGATELFGAYLNDRRSLLSEAGPPTELSAEVLAAVNEVSADDELVRNIELEALLDYPWYAKETKRFLAGALGFHQFETTGEMKRLLHEDQEPTAQKLELSKVSNEEMRSIIQERPEVLEDTREKAAGAYTFVEAECTLARALSFEHALTWLESRISPSERKQGRVTMIMGV